MRGVPPCPELPRALTPSELGLPTHVLDRRGERFEAALQVPTDRGRGALGPGSCHQSPTGLGMPGLREAALASALATGRCRRRQAQIIHEWSGVSDAGQVAECRDGRDRHRTRHATEGWPRLNDRAERPSADRLMACRFQALEPVSGCGDRPDLGLEDDGRGWARRPRAASAGAPDPTGLGRYTGYHAVAARR